MAPGFCSLLGHGCSATAEGKYPAHPAPPLHEGDGGDNRLDQDGKHDRRNDSQRLIACERRDREGNEHEEDDVDDRTEYRGAPRGVIPRGPLAGDDAAECLRQDDRGDR